MKLTPQQVVEALALLGVEAAEIVETDSDFDSESFLNMVDATRSKVLSPKIRAEMKADLELQIGGMIGKQLNTALKKKTGVDVKLFEGKSDEEKMDIALDHYISNVEKSKGDANETIQKLIADHEAEINKTRSELEQQIAAANEKYVDRDIEGYYRKMLDEIPLADAADKNFLASLVKQHMKDSHTLKYNEETKKMEYFLKDKPDMPVLVNNNLLNDVESVKSYLSKAGVVQTDMRSKNPADLMGNGLPKSIPMTGNTANARVADGGKSFIDDMKTYVAAAKTAAPTV